MNPLKALVGAYLLVSANFAFATDKAIDQSVKENTINRISELMIDNYVFPDMGEKTAKHLKEKLAAGEFDNIKQSKAFADALTDAVREVTKDKHLRVRPNRSGGRHHTDKDRIDELLDRRQMMRQRNNGIAEVKKLKDNVGYLDFRGFNRFDQAKESIDAAMKLLSTSDAIIIDIRKNGGGDPSTVQYLCSYFIDEHLLLNSLYWREGDVTNEFWTLDKVDGTKMPNVPLYIVTSGYTFSAAEEFSYNMQTRKRATLVGETTGGGANPGGRFKINDHFGMFIATGKAINPITNTNWEGVGVVPEVKVEKEAALDKAIALATDAAKHAQKQAREDYKQGDKKLTKLLEHQGETLTVAQFSRVKNTLFEQLAKLQTKMQLSEDQINMMGYRYLSKGGLEMAGLLLMSYNASQHPESANVYDSLGDAWLKLKQPEKAKTSYLKGLSLVGDNEMLKSTLEDNLAKANRFLQ